MQQIYYTKLSKKKNTQKSYLLSTSKSLPESIFEPIILIGKAMGPGWENIFAYYTQ